MAGSLLLCEFSLHLPCLSVDCCLSALLNASPMGAETPGWVLAYLQGVALGKAHGKGSINICEGGGREGERREEPRTWKSLFLKTLL